jgi:hypothetical protein
MVYSIIVIAAQILYAFMINVIQSLKPAGVPQQQQGSATAAKTHAYKNYKPQISSECAWAATCGDRTSINMHTLEQKIYFRRQPNLSQPNLSQEQPQQQTQIELMA